jgi:chemotaxis protein MotB
MKEGQIIIIKKKGGHGHGHHGGAWKVAYADFVTAMMAFFLVMWIVGQSQEVKAAIAGYFQNPGIFDQDKADGPIAGGSFKLDAEATPPAPRDQTELQLDDQAALESTAMRIQDLLSAVPDIQGLEDQIEISLSPDGLRIELLESAESSFFDSGSSAVKPNTDRVLSIIATELGKLKNTIVVEGHTDSLPFGSDRYTNWELSSDRANAARRSMEKTGLYPGQVQGVRGYADTHLRVPDDPADSANRRVSIIVQNVYRPDLLPARLRGENETPAPPDAPVDGIPEVRTSATADGVVEGTSAPESSAKSISAAARRRRGRR